LFAVFGYYSNNKGKEKMATVIRLAHYGAKKHPYYHIVVTDSRNARNSGNILAVVGKYDPMQPKDSDKRVTLKVDEIKSWLAKGAKASDRVYRFLAKAGLAEKKAYPVQTKKHLQSEKTLMKIKDKAAKLAKIAEEKAAAEAAAKEAVAAPASESAEPAESAAE
jgi:small subunit ribosomal protein S16